jgi:ribose/xylose/arabinose/galactoside ABC-type transport system permease subunit
VRLRRLLSAERCSRADREASFRRSSGVLLLGVIFNLFNLEGQISPWWQLVCAAVILLIVVVVQNRLTRLK